MKRFLCICALLISCSGCIRAWKPDTVYEETSTYDWGQTVYQEVGVSGPISDRVTMDLFAASYIGTNSDIGTTGGGGVRFEYNFGAK